MNLRMHVLLVVPVCALLVAGCGDDDADPTATNAPLPTLASSATAGRSPTSPASPAATPAPSTTAVATLPAGGTTTITVPAVPAGSTAQGSLKDVRTGLHPETSSERIVFEFQPGVLPAAKVEYITTAVQCGSGMIVPVAGSAVLNVVFTSAVAHDNAGKATIPASTVAGGGAPINEAKQTCDFEGQVAWAVGVKAKQAFVVTQLADPPRLAIDIKQ